MIELLFVLVTIICLFILYAIARHDFVLIRQNISLRQVFDNAFITIFVAFIVARIGFILYTWRLDLFSPLRFFYLFKYSGILPIAGFIGAFFITIFLYRKRKNKLRIFDITFIAFFPLMLLDILLQPSGMIGLIIKSVAFLVLLLFYIWFLRIHGEFAIKDGVITFLTTIVYCLVLLALSFVSFGVFAFPYIFYQGLIILVLLASSVLLFFTQKGAFAKQ